MKGYYYLYKLKNSSVNYPKINGANSTGKAKENAVFRNYIHVHTALLF